MEEVVERLVRRLGLGKLIRDRLSLPARPPRLELLPADLPSPLRQALAKRGVKSLYHHQLQAYLSAREGAHLLLATPTASGKSWALFLPLLRHLGEDPSATALLLFPTKALAREKARELESLFRELGLGMALSLDGESPPEERRLALQARAILTNPDMLRWHLGEWSPFLSRAAFLVVDELHLFQGMGGAMLATLAAQVRVLSPRVQFLCASATVGDPEGFFRRLFAARPAVIAESGAPAPARHLLSLRPPPGKEIQLVSLLARHLAREEGLDCLVFARGRQEAEMLLARIARLFPRWWEPLLRSYHGGLPPGERRKAEREAEGRRVGVFVATSAWEVGVEGGDFRAGIIHGYPGSRESFRQRVGRIGRKEEGLVLAVGRFPPLRELLLGALSSPPVPEGPAESGHSALPPPRSFSSPPFVPNARGKPLLREEKGERLFFRGGLYRVEKGILLASLPLASRHPPPPWRDPSAEEEEEERITVRLHHLLRGISAGRDTLWLPYPQASRHPFPGRLILQRGRAIAARAGLAPGDVEVASRPAPGGSFPAIRWRDPFPGAGGVEVLWRYLTSAPDSGVSSASPPGNSAVAKR